MSGADTLLAARLAAGDDRALAEVFDQFGPAVYYAAHRVLGDTAGAQDVVQEVFVELWRQPQRYDPAVAGLRTFLIVAARNRAIDLVRSDLRRVARQERYRRLLPASRHSAVDDELSAAEVACAVQAAVQLLPDGQRQVIELAYFEGLSYREVARAIGIPEGTAKSRLRIALAKLHTALDRQLLESS